MTETSIEEEPLISSTNENNIDDPFQANSVNHPPPTIKSSDSSSSESETSILKEIMYKIEEEKSWVILLQVIFPFLVAGLGMVAAGVVLDIVQHWPVFLEVSQIFILVPALLGLKGNLEMTLASRLSTAANTGLIDNRQDCIMMVLGNLSLIQAQALVIGFVASIVAIIFGWIPKGEFNLNHALLLAASSMSTAAVASFVLGLVMIGVIIASHQCNINPDNVATPIAASLGDITTLTILSWFSAGLYHIIKIYHFWIVPALIGILILFIPLWVYIAAKNKFTNDVVYSGWTPILSAMAISSGGGLILDFAVSAYKGIAVFQPVINGVGGNLVAVQASRLSTTLHKFSAGRGPGAKLPASVSLHGFPNIFRTYFSSKVDARTNRILLFLVIPGHLIFLYVISKLESGHTTITPIFTVVYVTAAFIQVSVLLYLATWMVHRMWRNGEDPDNAAIPYLTAIGDLLGTGLLALAFQVLYYIGDKDSDLGD